MTLAPVSNLPTESRRVSVRRSQFFIGYIDGAYLPGLGRPITT